MSDKSFQSYFIKTWLKSINEPLVFSVAEAAWGRFKRSYQAKKTDFFIFATRDGRTLALNLEYVQLAHNFRDEKTGVSKAKILFNFGRK